MSLAQDNDTTVVQSDNNKLSLGPSRDAACLPKSFAVLAVHLRAACQLVDERNTCHRREHLDGCSWKFNPACASATPLKPGRARALPK
jgi:hypothetical protein